MSEVAIALGANLGGAAEIAARFEAALAELAEVAAGPIRRSGLYAGAAVGPVTDQNEFINAVAVFDGVAGLAPEALLGRLLAIEAAHGRVRSVRFGPRTLDLDLLWFGERRVESAELSLPHPRMLERRFVLEPLAELLGADRVVPGAGERLGELLARPEVEPAALRRLPAG